MKKISRLVLACLALILSTTSARCDNTIPYAKLYDVLERGAKITSPNVRPIFVAASKDKSVKPSSITLTIQAKLRKPAGAAPSAKLPRKSHPSAREAIAFAPCSYFIIHPSTVLLWSFSDSPDKRTIRQRLPPLSLPKCHAILPLKKYAYGDAFLRPPNFV